jgi:hypothetical protein
MTAVDIIRPRDAPAPAPAPGTVRPPLPAQVFVLSAALAAFAALAAGLTYAFGGELTGTPVMNGSGRGTALVMLCAAVPVLVASTVAARRRRPTNGRPATNGR